MVTDAKENYRKSRRILSKKDSSGISIRCPKKSSQVVLVVKNPSANAGDVRDTGSIPGLGRSSGEGNSNPPQYSCPGNPMDRGAWWVTGHGVTKTFGHDSATKQCQQQMNQFDLIGICRHKQFV